MRFECFTNMADVPAVYFAGCRHNGYLKIGMSKNVRGRIKDLNHGLPFEIRIMKTVAIPEAKNSSYISAVRTLERNFKHFFRADRCWMEWYLFSDDLDDFISSEIPFPLTVEFTSLFRVGVLSS